MPYILTNCEYGGFHFSDEFVRQFHLKYPETPEEYLEVFTGQKSPVRTDKRVIDLFFYLGSRKSSGKHSHITIEHIPQDVDYTITDYDGIETVKWELPVDRIVQDLVGQIRPLENPQPLHPFTERILKENLTISALKRLLQLESNKMERLPYKS